MNKPSPKTPSITPVAIAEIGLDMLNYAARDAKQLAGDAAWLTLLDEGNSNAARLFERAVALERKLAGMIDDLSKMVAGAVAVECSAEKQNGGGAH